MGEIDFKEIYKKNFNKIKFFAQYYLGSKLPDFTSVDANGNEGTLSEMCKGKKYGSITNPCW